MQSGRYFFAIMFFLAFLTILIMFVIPVKVGNCVVSSYYSVPPNETLQYTQVIDGTNSTAYIVLDNSGGDAYDLTNLYFKVKVRADSTFIVDYDIAVRTWDNNFTILKGETKTLKLVFNATFDGYPNARIFYISISWGISGHDEFEARLTELSLGSDFILESFWTLKNIITITMSIAMAATVLIVVIAARKDIKRRKHRRRPSPPSLPPSTLPPPTTPSVLVPPSTTSLPPSASRLYPPPPPAEPLPTVTIELIPCPKCGSKIDKTQIICSNCGYELPKCSICNLVIDDDDQIETCPECGAIGHRPHFREWVHVKGICPICKKKISFS